MRILCFGDSLTSGHPVDNPYAFKLAQAIEESGLLAPGEDVECVVDGLPGDMAALNKGRFLQRMTRGWDDAEADGKRFDWTIVLGGTNDIGWGHEVKDIEAGLKTAWDVPLSRGGKVLALTIPDCKYKTEKLTQKRNAINDLIKGYKKPGFFHYDLNTSLPYHAMPEQDRPKYWDTDGLHLARQGYDFMGTLIGEQGLCRILRLAEAQDTDIGADEVWAKDAEQRRQIEELIVEEERGDHRLLSQGYIVVRKKDLH